MTPFTYFGGGINYYSTESQTILKISKEFVISIDFKAFHGVSRESSGFKDISLDFKKIHWFQVISNDFK